MKFIERSLLAVIAVLLIAIAVRMYNIAKTEQELSKQAKALQVGVQMAHEESISATVTLNPKIGDGIAVPGAVPPPPVK